MTDYEKQAQDFLDKTNTTIDFKFQCHGPMPFDHDGTRRDIYMFTITRGGREYSSEFGQSTANKGVMPTAYDLLSCLDPLFCMESPDEVAEEFGYTKPSDAIRVYEAMTEQAQGLQALFSQDECEQLIEIS